MELIIQNDGLIQLIPITKQMMEPMSLSVKVNCFELCEIFRLKLTTYAESLNLHMMIDGSGNFIGCICKQSTTATYCSIVVDVEQRKNLKQTYP